jgi:general secretion pathway protein L
VKILGVDIGSYSLKVAEVDDSSAKGVIFNQYFEVPLSLDPTKDRGLQVIEALRSLSSQYEASKTSWIIGLSQNQISMRDIRFPFRERIKILRSLPFELEDEIPLDIDEAIFEAKIIETLGSSAHVLSIAAPKEAVEAALELAKDGGFNPEIISVEALALANMFTSWEAPPPEGREMLVSSEGEISPPRHAQLVLHLGHTHTNLLVLREGVLIAARSILWGGGEITETIATAFKISPFEATKLLNSKSFVLMNSAGATREQLALSQAITGPIDILMRELKLTLLEMRATYNLIFDEMLLSGGVSQIQNLAPYVTAATEIQTGLAHPFQAIRQTRFEATPSIEATSVLAIGLAIEGLRKPRNPAINLRREEFAQENEGLKRFIAIWKIPAQVAAVAFVLLCIFTVVRDAMTARLLEVSVDRVNSFAVDVAHLKGASANEDGVRSFIAKQDKLVKDHESLTQVETLNSALDIMAKLSEKLPIETKPRLGQGIDVTHLAIDNEDVVIEGRAQGTITASIIEKVLNDIAKPKTVSRMTASAQAAGAVGTPFAFRFKVNRRPE